MLAQVGLRLRRILLTSPPQASEEKVELVLRDHQEMVLACFVLGAFLDCVGRRRTSPKS